MITLTESAVRMVRRIMEKEGRSAATLRVGVKGGGCSGFSYHMDYETQPRDGDQRFEFHGLPVVVDPRSMELLQEWCSTTRRASTGLPVEEPQRHQELQLRRIVQRLTRSVHRSARRRGAGV
jgi:iron-sulfur cluster assembly accessory protein